MNIRRHKLLGNGPLKNLFDSRCLPVRIVPAPSLSILRRLDHRGSDRLQRDRPKLRGGGASVQLAQWSQRQLGVLELLRLLAVRIDVVGLGVSQNAAMTVETVMLVGESGALEVRVSDTRLREIHSPMARSYASRIACVP